MSKVVNDQLFFTYQEIADKLGFTYGTVGTMVSRGTFSSVKFPKDSKKYISEDQLERYLHPDKYRSNIAVQTAEREVPQGSPFISQELTDLTSIKLAAIQAMKEAYLDYNQRLTTLMESCQISA